MLRIVMIALITLLAQAPEGKLAFDVASVKKQPPGSFHPPLFPLDSGDSFAVTGGRFYADFPVATYITFAYKLMLTPEQRQAMIASLPKWAASDVFEIEAKAPMSNPTKDQMRLMMQSLLADRFQLRIHFETRETPVYALVLAKPGKLGPKLIPHDQGRSCDAPAPDIFPPRCGNLGMMLPNPNAPRTAGARDVPMAYIAEGLPTLTSLGRSVVDQTGLSGKFDFTIQYVPNMGSAPPPTVIGRSGGGGAPSLPPANAGTPPEVDGPAFADALRDQLGLKLESTKAPVRTPVIDRIETPSEN